MAEVSTIKVYIPDSIYGRVSDEAWSPELKEELESEFGLPFEEENIGPGFDIPAFVAQIPNEAWVAGGLSLFFLGKKIDQNLDGWSNIYKKLKAFFGRKPEFSREARLSSQ